ncbi:CLUMA_CG012292, isoform A [Clunio marinus]|uniref:CLUMA_CG012292, isoform A n=1 Tax=Clunio marinus TaxID=568069 RepID=A0A1J1IF80_9DIPT|nr:CLUMA_CG012292, isoform A [Clunio marinus]
MRRWIIHGNQCCFGLQKAFIKHSKNLISYLKKKSRFRTDKPQILKVISQKAFQSQADFFYCCRVKLAGAAFTAQYWKIGNFE